MAAISSNLDSLHAADHLGSALQQGLPRPMNPRLSWTLLRTLVLGGLSGGIISVWVLPGRFGRFVESERMQYWHLAEWMRLNGATEADAATRAANEMKPAYWLPLFAKLFAIVAIGIGISAVRSAHSPEVSSFHAWMDLVWAKLPPATGRFDEMFGVATKDQKLTISAKIAQPSDLILPFNLAITGACLCWLMQINSHVGRVGKFVSAFNRSSEHFGVGPVRAPGWNIGLRPAWVGSAIILAIAGGYWAIPLLLASAAQRSHVIRTTRRMRSDLARRQRDVLLSKRPPVHVPASNYLLGNCPQANCRAPLPPEAVFCKRCGTRLANVKAGRVV